MMGAATGSDQRPIAGMDAAVLYLVGMVLLSVGYGMWHAGMRSSVQSSLTGFMVGLVVGVQLFVAVESGSATRWVMSVILHVLMYGLTIVVVRPRRIHA